MGSPHELQINGLGGGNSLTSKVAIVSRSTRPHCDVDYLFAQVSTDHALVDTRPNCGNLLSGVAPFAIEAGLVQAQDGTTRVRIFNINTSTVIEATVQTPGRHVLYEGNTRIDGVPGTGAPIVLDFLNAEGGITGAVFPTGSRTDSINGIAVTCIDVAMPVMIVQAAALGLTGAERPVELDANAPLLKRLEALRLEAGRRMGLGDVSSSVVPKPVIVSSAGGSGRIQSRYFTPHRCHKAHAVTGAIAVASSAMIPGTVSNALLGGETTPLEGNVAVVHPAGQIEIALAISLDGEAVHVTRAGLIRTARKIMQGKVFVPALDS
jgi:2-methylaconitate cis-trans-isomerase PrpF